MVKAALAGVRKWLNIAPATNRSRGRAPVFCSAHPIPPVTPPTMQRISGAPQMRDLATGEVVPPARSRISAAHFHAAAHPG